MRSELAPRTPSGIIPVDVHWGGFVPGGAYLLVGAARQGRNRLAALATRAAIEAEQACLLLSPREPQALVADAAAAGLDLGAAHARGLARLLRTPPPAELAALGDAGLAAALAEFAETLAEQRPARVVLDDFTPFVQFRTFDAFEAALGQLVAACAGLGTTLLFGLGEPANDGSRRLLALVEGRVAGTLHVRRASGGSTELALMPGTDHVGQAYTAPWAPTSVPAPRRNLFTETPLTAAPDATSPPPSPEADVAPDFTEHSADGYTGDATTQLGQPVFHLSVAPPESSLLGGASPAPPAEPGAARVDRASWFPPLSGPLPNDGRLDNAPLAGPFGPDTFAGEPLTGDPFAQDPSGGGPPPEALDLPPGVAWAGVQPLSPDEGALFDESLLVPPGPDPLAAGHLIESDWDGFDAAPAALAAAYPEAPAAPPPPINAEAAFRRDLAAAFAQRGQSPFLVVALRMDVAGPYGGTFPAVADGLLGALGPDARALVRDDEARLAALLPDAGPDGPARAFGMVKAHLRTILGDEAEQALKAVGVLVAPDGQPFETPEELLEYALG